MLDLKIYKNKSYINSGNIFSKLLMLQKYFESEKSILIIVENEKKINEYIKINNYLKNQKLSKKNIYELNNISDLVNIIYNKKWIYITTKDLFSLEWNFHLLEEKNIFVIEKKQNIEISSITKKLNDFHYTFSENENSGTFQITWDTLSFIDMSWHHYKITFWWDNVDEIIDMEDKKNIESLFIWKNVPLLYNNIQRNNDVNFSLKDKISVSHSMIILDSVDFCSEYDSIITDLNNFIDLSYLWNNKEKIDLSVCDLCIESIEDLKNILKNKSYEGKYIFTKSIKTFKNFLELNNIENIHVHESSINSLKSFVVSSPPPNPPPIKEGGSKKKQGEVFICDDNIGRLFIKKRVKRSLSKNLNLLLQIKTGDYIVHIDHGIWIFAGIQEKNLGWIKKEYITLEYKNNDILFVPITEVSRVSKYVWVENPKLTPLSTKEWERKLQKVHENVEIIARELLEVHARRNIQKWFSFLKFLKQEQEFQKSFEYKYTDDQIHSIQEIFDDMEQSSPMDRLLSWDVGFWKTEVAFNAIYKCLLNNKQAAFISPLTVLTYEHFEKAKERFKDLPFNIEVLTRFEKANKIKSVLEKLKNWQVDLVIWTHRILSKDIVFKNLWLLIVDEEHKFGVKDKEKIKELKDNIDILSMSATPIPRSLNMALNGIKSISMLTTPPEGRQPISTIVSRFNDNIILQAGKNEFARWGQLFFIHNRVETISHMQLYLEKIFPSKKIIITHGQLPWDTLEKRIIEFKQKKYDILLSTTVIENGIDFANVNTIIINEAQNFWISQIHQLRWRVGRSEKKWYCYMLFKKDAIKEDAAKRLKTIVDYSHLWSGFELAIKDLEIRWWWEILGVRQSGQSVEIGVNLFLQMLENKIEELKNNSLIPEGKNSIMHISTKIDLNIWAYISDDFFWSELDKINFYREIESLENMQDLNNIIIDFKEINKNLPKETHNFFSILELKLLAHTYKISQIKKIWINYQVDFEKNSNPLPSPPPEGEGNKKENKQIKILKAFLEKDIEVKFKVISVTRLRSEVKNFANDESFLQYMLQLLKERIWNKKIKLKG
jgi:transcription-repair coupling factor